MDETPEREAEPPAVESRRGREEALNQDARMAESLHRPTPPRDAAVYLIEREAILLRRRRWSGTDLSGEGADRIRQYERPPDPTSTVHTETGFIAQLRGWLRAIFSGD